MLGSRPIIYQKKHSTYGIRLINYILLRHGETVILIQHHGPDVRFCIPKGSRKGYRQVVKR